MKSCGTVRKWYWEDGISLLCGKDSVWQVVVVVNYGRRYPMIIKSPQLFTTGR